MKILGTFIAAVAMVAMQPLTANALDKTRPIRMVVAFPAGGVTDLASRVVANALSHELGQPVIVENKAGGDGVNAIIEVTGSAPDGNTLLSGGFGGQLIPPLMKKNFPVDIEKQLTLIARPTEFTNVLLVNKEVPVNSVKEFMDYVAKHPGELNYGSAGSSSSDRLTTVMFMQKTGLELNYVPYKGSAAALNDLSAGIIQVMFGNLPPALGLIEGGNLKPLAVTAPYRVPQLPDVPTMQEAGVDGFSMTSWNSLFGPAGMSDEDVKTLSDSISAAVMKPDTQKKLRDIGFEPIGEGAEAFRKHFAADKARWKQVIDTAGLAN